MHYSHEMRNSQLFTKWQHFATYGATAVNTVVIGVLDFDKSRLWTYELTNFTYIRLYSNVLFVYVFKLMIQTMYVLIQNILTLICSYLDLQGHAVWLISVKSYPWNESNSYQIYRKSSLILWSYISHCWKKEQMTTKIIFWISNNIVYITGFWVNYL